MILAMRAHTESDQSLAAAKTTDQITDPSRAFWPPPPEGVANSELVSGVPPAGLEPATVGLKVRCSAIELGGQATDSLRDAGGAVHGDGGPTAPWATVSSWRTPFAD